MLELRQDDLAWQRTMSLLNVPRQGIQGSNLRGREFGAPRSSVPASVRRSRVGATLGMGALLATTLLLVSAPVVSANGPLKMHTCPPTYAPGTTIDGGLDVAGECVLTGVTINGGVVIESSGHLTLYGSTVNGQTKVNPGGEFDSDTPEMPGGANILNGGVDADTAVEMDLHRGVINGVVRFVHMAPSNSPFGAARFSFCGVGLEGSLDIEDMRAFPSGVHVGDFETAGRRPQCAGNAISGSIVIRDNPGSRIEIEQNTIGGSVEIWNSQPSLSLNKIGGGVHCHQSATLGHWDPDDTNTNNGGELACA